MTAVLGAALEKQRAKERVIDSFEDILEVTDDMHVALAAVGRDYASLRRTLIGANRLDLVLRLKTMNEADRARLQDALGLRRQS